MREFLFLCAETFPSDYAFLGSVFNQILRTQGYRFNWVMPSTAVEQIEETRWDGHPVWLIPKPSSAGVAGLIENYVAHLGFVQRAADEALGQIGAVDAVQVRDDPVMAYVAWRLSRRRRMPFIYQLSHFKEEEHILYAKMKLYGSAPKNYFKGRVGLLARNYLLRRADLVFPISAQMKQSLASYGIPPETMVTLPEGADASIDPDQFEEAASDMRRQLNLEDGRVLIYIGTMNRFRQLDFLFRVLRDVLSSFPDVHLLMVGDGMDAGDLPWLKMTARELGVEDSVTFTGRVPRTQVPVYICASDIGLSPVPPNAVYFNSSPIKILEYLNLGVCCVASDIPSQRRTIDDSRGGLCVSHEEKEFAKAISRLLSLTDAQRREMGMAGRRYVRVHRDFDVLAMVAKEAYTSLGIC